MSKHEFPVDRRRVRNARLQACTYFLMPVGIVAFIIMSTDGFFPDRGTASLFALPYLFVAVASFPLVLLGFYFLRLVPKGAEAGSLRLDPHGLDYAIGPIALQVPWAQVAAVHVFRSDFDGAPRALWLARRAGPEPAVSRLRRMLGNRLAHPVEAEDGTLVPLLLFSADDARAILVASRELHARALA